MLIFKIHLWWRVNSELLKYKENLNFIPLKENAKQRASSNLAIIIAMWLIPVARSWGFLLIVDVYHICTEEKLTGKQLNKFPLPRLYISSSLLQVILNEGKRNILIL